MRAVAKISKSAVIFRYGVAVLPIFFAATSAATAGENQWTGLMAANAYLKQVKAQNRIVTRFDCRSPKNSFMNKVEVRIVSKPNPSGREWAAYAYKGILDYRPGPPSDWHLWRRISTVNVSGTGGAFRCSLFHHK